MTADWCSQRLRRVFLDMHMPDWTRPGQSGGAETNLKDVATRFDLANIVANLARAHVNVVVFFAKCQYGNFYYDTQIGHKHTGLGEQDLLGEFLACAHANDIQVIAYYSNGWDVEVARAHPDWMMQDEAGRSSYNRWPRVCFHSPYRELVHSHLHEMFSRYALDGIWLDMLHVLPCYCPRCAARFQARFDRPMPLKKQGQIWLEMVHWQYAELEEYVAQAHAIVANLRPDAVLTLNFYGSPYAPPSLGLGAISPLKYCAYGSTEGYTEWHGLLFPSYAARYMHALLRAKPSEILISRFIRTWDFTLRPLEQIKFEAFSVAAQGAAVCLDDEPYHDGRLEPRVYDALGEVYKEIEARERYLIGAEPIYFVGLYHSLKTREVAEMLVGSTPNGEAGDFYGFYPEDLEAPSDVVLSTQGAFKALVESHLPLEFLHEEGLTVDELSRFRALYLPNVIAMTDEEAGLLREYVQNGGGLVATGATSLYDSRGAQRSNFLLADLFGVDYVGPGPFSFSYMQFQSGALDLHPGEMPLSHYRSLLLVRLNRPAQVAATVVEPIIQTRGELYYHNNQPAPYRRTEIPAVVLTQFGKGRVVYVSGEPEANYAVLGYSPYRELIRKALLWAARGPYEILPHVPKNTQVIYRRQAEQIVLHFVTGWSQQRVVFRTRSTAESIEESFPIFDVRVEVPLRISSARLVPDELSLEIQRRGDQAWIILPKIQRWETLLLNDPQKHQLK